jgi:flagellar biosynthesis protein FlhG
MRDQAERLRQIAASMRGEVRESHPSRQRRARVVAVASGKGGVGKTNVSVNLSYALMSLGREVILLDADLDLANVDVLLGTMPKLQLAHALLGNADILDLIYEGPGHLKLIAGGSSLEDIAGLPERDVQRLIFSLRKLEAITDYLLIDTGAGLGPHVINFASAADVLLVVTTPEPTAMTDAYALIKMISRRNPAAEIKVIFNQVQDATEAREASERLVAAVLKFLGIIIEVIGEVPIDAQVQRSVRKQQPFFLAAPSCRASASILDAAHRLVGDPLAHRPRVGMFIDRLSKVISGWTG